MNFIELEAMERMHKMVTLAASIRATINSGEKAEFERIGALVYTLAEEIVASEEPEDAWLDYVARNLRMIIDVLHQHANETRRH